MGEQGPGPGWYPHPSMANTRRYWDGEQWTDHLAPGAASPAARPPDALIGIGWVLTLLFPLAGFVIGIVVMAKGASGHGLGMICGSVLVAAIWMATNGY